MSITNFCWHVHTRTGSRTLILFVVFNEKKTEKIKEYTKNVKQTKRNVWIGNNNNNNTYIHTERERKVYTIASICWRFAIINYENISFPLFVAERRSNNRLMITVKSSMSTFNTENVKIPLKISYRNRGMNVMIRICIILIFATFGDLFTNKIRKHAINVISFYYTYYLLFVNHLPCIYQIGIYMIVPN